MDPDVRYSVLTQITLHDNREVIMTGEKSLKNIILVAAVGSIFALVGGIILNKVTKIDPCPLVGPGSKQENSAFLGKWKFNNEPTRPADIYYDPDTCQFFMQTETYDESRPLIFVEKGKIFNVSWTHYTPVIEGVDSKIGDEMTATLSYKGDTPHALDIKGMGGFNFVRAEQ